ncbi:MAG: hypothetical protein HYV36_09155 [Lentisphaerae bacterium]|nr:hypothetical protein [Lentisphaerota bacterium]
MPLTLNFQFGFWDWLLLLVVTLQATVIAYLYRPKWKALALSLPFPFTVAYLALGQPVNATNVSGLALWFGFMHGVRILRQNRRWPIVPTIAAMALAYSGIALALAPVLPASGAAFWLSMVLLLTLACWGFFFLPHQDEPGHRTSLPLWAKLPILAAVVLFLLILKKYMQGFMTVFPMVSVLAVYEARHSLGTMCRQMPAIAITLMIMFAIIRLAEPGLGCARALALSWIACLILFVFFTRRAEDAPRGAGQALDRYG